MYLLYLDDAGSPPNKEEKYFVLGGVAVFEAQAHFITQELDKIAESIDPSNPADLEFHASEIFSRRIYPWNKMSKSEAQGVIKAVLNVFKNCYDTAKAFACAIHKDSYKSNDPVELAFEDLCSRFDIFLSKLKSEGNRQRGLFILDKSAYETTLQKMAINFRKLGTQWGVIRNLADVPLFIDSRASRVIQLADHIAYAIFRRYNAGDTQYFDIIASKFVCNNGVIHSLCHKQTVEPTCMCPACLSRRFYQDNNQETELDL